MSGIDVASGIAGLISLALQVSDGIARYVIAVKDHAKVVKELQEELQLLGNVLSRLSDFLQSESAKGRSFEDDSVLVNAIRGCKQRIERIGDKIKTSDGGKISRTIEKLKWPFEQKDVLQLVENLRRYIHTFEFAITIKNSEFLAQRWDDASKSLQDLQKKVDQACETSKMLGEPIDVLLQRSKQLQTVVDILSSLMQQSEDLKEVSQVVKLAEQREQERRKADILDWLCPLSTLHKHIELQNRRTHGTCKWLLESEMFIDWAESREIQYDMHCQGGPGVGKTMLCSVVTDYLRERYKSDEVAIIYYYFDLTEHQSQTDHSLARSILRQLCQTFRTIPAAVADFYQRTRNELQDTLWLQEVLAILQRVVATFAQCFIIVDAFDEIDVKKRGSLIRVLESIRASNGRVKFFATSRPYVNLELFQHALKLDVRADEKDIRGLLNQKIDAHPHASEIMDKTLKEELLDRLCLHADGVFLLPALQIDQILDQAVSAGDIERSLQSLSTNLKEVFKSTIFRIEGFSGSRRDLAFKTLMWLSHARRALKISELQHAIAMRSDIGDLHLRDVSSEAVIIDSCCGLIELDGASATIKFVHGSIAEYLQSENHGFFKDAELEITKVCLRYLSMEHLKFLPYKNRRDFLRDMETYPLLEYASSYWGLHARGIGIQEYQDLAIPLLTSSPHLLVTVRVKDIKTPEARKWKERMNSWALSGGAGISLAASFGLADLTRSLISKSQAPMLTARNMYGSTPLHESAILGHEEVAELLIAHGADVLDSNNGKATPFYLAVSYGQMEMCRLLLRHGKLQLDVACKGGNTALHKAADLGSDTMVEFLLQSGALVEARNDTGMTPLHSAARSGRISVVQMLILRGANPRSIDNLHTTPLDLAILYRHLDIAEYLLAQGVNIHHKSSQGWTALHRAARAGHAKAVKLLLDAGASVLDLNRQVSNALHLAIQSGNLESVKIILHHDAAQVEQQLRHMNRTKHKAIDIAFYTSNYHVYEYIRDVESEIMVRDAKVPLDPLLPLNHAIEQGFLPQVEKYLQANPSWLTSKDYYDQTPLHTAFRTRQWLIAEHLLSLGASINSRGHHGWTPLHIAAATGDFRMLSLALQWDADIFLVSDTGQSALHKAASSASIEIVHELLRCGCRPSDLNGQAMSAVHVAAQQNFQEGVLLMIQPEYGGRNILFHRDAFKCTPREWAEKAGHLEMSVVLRDEERRAKGRLGEYNSATPPLSGSPGSRRTRHATVGGDLLSRQSTSSSLQAPTSERSVSGQESLGSLLSLEDVSPRHSGISSPQWTPGTPVPNHAGLSHKPSITEIEQTYAAMQLDFESD